MNSRINQMSDSWFKATEQLNQDVLVELWTIDLRVLGGQIYRFANLTNELGKNIIWQGQEFSAYPIKGEGFEVSTQGTSNRPNLTISNVLGFVTGAMEQYDQLKRANVYRHLVYAQFLDGENFKEGNPTADPLQEIKTSYVVERMVSLTREQGVFELAVPSESDGATVPSRVMTSQNCCWQYRGEGCGYTGHAVADENDMPTNDPLLDQCGKRLLSCKARFGETAVLPYGAFPSAKNVKA